MNCVVAGIVDGSRIVWVVLVCGCLLGMAFVGVACRDTDIGPGTSGMTDRLKLGVREARSGRTFMESALFDVKLSAEEVAAAKGYVMGHPDVSAYILLMSLREHAPVAYAGIPDACKARVLCDALANLTFLNDFGYLESSASYDDMAGKALITIGKPAVNCLRALLGDKSQAPLFGSEAATLSGFLQYRRADFAYRYIMLILGKQPAFPADTAERDKLISDLQEQP